MATIRLGRFELEEYDLPRVCMCCGARASTYKSKKFSWCPPWAFFLGWIGRMIFTRKITLSVPLCQKHEWHFGVRLAYAIVGVVLLLVFVFGGALLAEAVKHDAAGFVFLPLLVLFLAWLIGLIILLNTSIRPKEITDKSVTLTGVSEAFVEALDDARRGDEDERPRRGRFRDEDEDEDRPRRRRRVAEEEQERPRAKRRAADEDDGGYYDPEKKRRRPPPDAYEEGDDR